MVPENTDDPARAGEPRVRPDLDDHGTRAHEAVDEVLREAPVDLSDAARRALPAVPARVVHVHVEPVLVRGVLRPEGPAATAAEIADPDARGMWVGACVLTHDSQDDPDELEAADDGLGEDDSPGIGMRER